MLKVIVFFLILAILATPTAFCLRWDVRTIGQYTGHVAKLNTGVSYLLAFVPGSQVACPLALILFVAKMVYPPKTLPVTQPTISIPLDNSRM